MKRYWSAIIILLITSQGLCQTNNTRKLHAFSGTMVVSLEGGFTLSKSDYKYTKLGGRLTMGIEYYLPTSSIHILGFRAFGGGQQVYSKEAGKIVDVPDMGSILLPDLIKTDMYIAGVGVIYSISIKDRVFPYISGGLSNIWFSPKLENGDRAPFNALNKYKRNALVYDFDMGIKYQIINNLSVKLEGGLHFPNTDNLDDIATGKNKDFYATGILGISYSFFRKKDSDGDGVPDEEDMCSNTPVGIKVDEHGCPIDSDNDGVPDYLDKCPDTEQGITVDAQGCPKDTDGDGIPDDKDLCPNTPHGVKVDANGCPVDSDNDGVPDYLDKCPDTPSGMQVNEAGCPDSDGDGIYDDEDNCPKIPGPPSNKGCPDSTNEYIAAPKEIVIEDEATFVQGKADILPAAHSELNRIVKLLQPYPDVTWRIEGYTDKVESENLMVRPLSLRRAEAILNYFVSNGLPSFQFRVYDMGDKSPIANNNTEFGRNNNKRVVLVREN